MYGRHRKSFRKDTTPLTPPPPGVTAQPPLLPSPPGIPPARSQTSRQHPSRMKDSPTMVPPHSINASATASDKEISSDMRRLALNKESSERRLRKLRESMRRSVPFVRPLKDPAKKEFRRESLLAAPIRIFYETEEARNEAFDVMQDFSELMSYLAKDASEIITSSTSTPEQQEEVVEYLLWDGIDLNVTKINGVGCYGVEVVEGLFWEAYVMNQDSGSALFNNDRSPPSKRGSDTSNESDAQFQNFKMIRAKPCSTKRTVVWQMDRKSPMRPETLVIAVEKDGKVTPSDVGEKFYRHRSEEEKEEE